jgi:diacylglycerol kinase family enzyme
MAGGRSPATLAKPHFMSDASVSRIPAFVNAKSGTADEAREALSKHEAFDVRVVEPEKIESELQAAVLAGARRILVAGGDGTIATAAATLIPTKVELAILPGGTLNHFARDLGISTEHAKALVTATGESRRGVDVGMVNHHVFLNTASVGAYVQFVRMREYLERRFGYRIASTLAAFRILFGMQRIAIELEVDGKARIYRTPLVFIGVGERELQLPTLGNRVPDGRRGLHVIAVTSRSRARLLAIALAAVARGVKTVARGPEVDSFIVDKVTITRTHTGPIALDGELVTLGQTVTFELKRDALQVVCP